MPQATMIIVQDIRIGNYIRIRSCGIWGTYPDEVLSLYKSDIRDRLCGVWSILLILSSAGIHVTLNSRSCNAQVLDSPSTPQARKELFDELRRLESADPAADLARALR